MSFFHQGQSCFVENLIEQVKRERSGFVKVIVGFFLADCPISLQNIP